MDILHRLVPISTPSDHHLVPISTPSDHYFERYERLNAWKKERRILKKMGHGYYSDRPYRLNVFSVKLSEIKVNE